MPRLCQKLLRWFLIFRKRYGLLTHQGKHQWIYKGRIMVMIHVFIKKKNRPYFKALRRGGVYSVYPVWPQRSLLCILRVSTHIMSLVFIFLPWSKETEAHMLSFWSGLYFWTASTATMIGCALHSNTNFFTSGPLCSFSSFHISVWGSLVQA